MKVKIVCYRFDRITPSRRMMFHKEMYGYRDYSNKGKYIYQRKGVLDFIKHRKIIDSVIITNNEGAKIIKKTLNRYGARIYLFDIIAPFKL